MPFIVDGIDRKTGQRTQILSDAATLEKAAVAADLLGIQVRSINPASPTQVLPSASPPASVLSLNYGGGPTLPHAARDISPAVRLWIGPGLAWLIVASIWVMIVLVIEPNFMRVFRDFKITLPWPTEVTLRVADIARSYYLWPLAFALPVAAVALTGRAEFENGRYRQSTSGVVIRRAGSLVAVLSIGWAVVVNLLPMIALIGAVSGATK